MSEYLRISAEIRHLAFRLSLLLKVIGTGTDHSATYDFIIVAHSNHGPISYCFSDKRRFQSKSQNFPTLVYAPAERLPLEFCNDVGTPKKLE